MEFVWRKRRNTTWNIGKDSATLNQQLNPRPSEYETVLDHDIHTVLVLYVFYEETSCQRNEMQQQQLCNVNTELIWLVFRWDKNMCDVTVTVIVLRHADINSELRN